MYSRVKVTHVCVCVCVGAGGGVSGGWGFVGGVGGGGGGGGGGAADVWSVSGGCDSGTGPPMCPPDGTYGGALLPTCPIMSHIS